MQVFSHENHKDVRSADSRRHLFSRKVALLGIALLLVSLLSVLTFVPSNGTPKAHAATWTEVWGDEFNGAAGTGVNTSNWIYDTGQGFGTGEIETMSNSTANVYQDGNGHLVIKALRDANGNWTSGRIETQRDDFNAPAGGEFAMEATLQQPNLSGAAAAGYWPAFWSLGTPYRTDHSWPKDGEIDILEDINGLSSVFGTLHCGVDPGGPCNETTGIGSGQRACAGCQTAFHTYRVEVDRSVSPEQIRWYLDGVNYFTVSANQVDPTTWSNAVDHAFYIIFDLAMGGGFPAAFGGGPTAATQSGGSMIVDDVRVYTANGNVTPTATPTTSPTGGYAVNSGGGATGSFQADNFSTGGTTAATTSSITTSGVSNPAPQAVYQSERYGNFSYTFPGLQVGGSYTVRLHFAEFYWSQVGQRVFNVSINGTQVLSNFDIIKTAGGADKAVIEQFTTTANGSGQITIQFSTVVDNAKVSGIEIIPASGSTPVPTPTSTTGSCSGNFSQGVNNVSSNQGQFWFQPCGWTAGYVIVHYTIPGQTQQNVTMTYNSGAGQWQYTAGGMSSGQVITYSFTYQKSGLQYDSSSYTWTHP